MTPIERAARAYYARHIEVVNAADVGFKLPTWDELSDDDLPPWFELAQEVLAAAYPGLMSEPPDSWVAPWTPSAPMWEVTAVAGWPADSWNELRDAHLKDTPTP